MADKCAKCGRAAEGAHFTFYYGKYLRTTSSRSMNTVTTKTHFQIAGSQRVFLCTTCQIADRRNRALILTCVWIVMAIVWMGVACLVAIPNPWRDALGQSISDSHDAGSYIFIAALIYLFWSLFVIAGPFVIGRDIAQWNKPYADPQSGVATSEENEQAGSQLAIRLRNRELRRLGYHKFFTPSERWKLRGE